MVYQNADGGERICGWKVGLLDPSDAAFSPEKILFNFVAVKPEWHNIKVKLWETPDQTSVRSDIFREIFNTTNSNLSFHTKNYEKGTDKPLW